MIKTWIGKLKSFICSFFNVYWEETTMRINDNEVIELGGFILVILVFLGGLFLFDCFITYNG